MAAAATERRRESRSAWSSSPLLNGDLRRRSEFVMLLRLLSGRNEGSIDEALPSRLAKPRRGSGGFEDVLLVLPVSSSKLRSSSDGT